MISIITPLLNEEGYVKPFLANLRMLEGDFELIIVDGGSVDDTIGEVLKCIEGFGSGLRLLKSDRGRALQMNNGAKKARGDILLFLHVDCSLEKDALKLIEWEIYEKNNIGGGFRQAFSDPDLFLTIVSAFGNLRTMLTKTFYGDYGIFLRKDIFNQMGGFDNIPFFEDAELCRKAKKYGKLIQIDRRIITSPRRYLGKGRFMLTAAFILAYFFNIAGFQPGFFTKYIVDK